jgi:F0F1-type ATP synthase beta subunit
MTGSGVIATTVMVFGPMNGPPGAAGSSSFGVLYDDVLMATGHHRERR